MVYIGKLITIEKRIQRHFQELRKNRHCNQHFQRAFNKYGEDKFSTKILEICEENQLNEREIYWINKLDMINMGFNQNSGGDGGARTFGIHTTYSNSIVYQIAHLLEYGFNSNDIAKIVFGIDSKEYLDYIGRIRRKEIRRDLLVHFNYNTGPQRRKNIPDDTIHEICRLLERGLSNKAISLKIFGDWNSTRWNYLIKLRNRKARKDITKNYDWETHQK